MIIVDAHLDLAYNAINNGRNLQQPLNELRLSEGSNPPAGIATVTLPEIKRAGVGLVFGTLFTLPIAHSQSGELAYKTADDAFALANQQFDYYHRLADEDETIRLVTDSRSLQEVLDSFAGENGRLLGIIPSMEGADPIRVPEELEQWAERGLKAIGLAWDDTRYSAGAWRGSRFDITKEGYALLEMMAEFNMILDISHMSERASLLALERYEGTAVASHSNCRHLVPGERQLSDQQIRHLHQKNGIIGVVLYNKFLRAHHKAGDPKERVTLDHVVAHIDHICQLIGDAKHVAIGSDLDGGFGYKDTPYEINSIFDLNKLVDKLKQHGYDAEDISNIMGQNWVRLLKRTFV